MAEQLCGVCQTEPKKYKCPTCALPYCSISCFKNHKTIHSDAASIPPAPAESPLPQAPPPAPAPSYLKKKTDLSILATNPKFQELLKTSPTLLATLQRIYSKTIEPDPESEYRRIRIERQVFRGRGSRGRGRGRGRGNHFDEGPRRWTQKQGDSDAMKALKSIRDGKGDKKEKEGMAEFVRLVEDLFGDGENKTGEHG